MSRCWGVGADAGEAAAWALVEWSGAQYRLLSLRDVYGEGRHWLRRAQLGARATWDALLDATDQRAELAACAPVWVEEPPAYSRRLESGHRIGQQSWVGLGRRVGLLEGMWWVETAGASAAQLHPPGDWYDELHRLVRRGKNPADGGQHRIAEASQLVLDAAVQLAHIPAGRRIDAAESVLIACAAAKSARPSPPARPFSPAPYERRTS